MTWASCRKRLRATGSVAADWISSLIATSRPRPGCSARHTAPIPPRPSPPLTRYLPMNRSPAIGGGVATITGIGGGGADGGGTGISLIVAETSETYGAGGGAGGATGWGAVSAGESGEFGAHGGTPGVKESGGVPWG